MDLADLSSVKDFAERFLSSGRPLHVLVRRTIFIRGFPCLSSFVYERLRRLATETENGGASAYRGGEGRRSSGKIDRPHKRG